MRARTSMCGIAARSPCLGFKAARSPAHPHGQLCCEDYFSFGHRSILEGPDGASSFGSKVIGRPFGAQERYCSAGGLMDFGDVCWACLLFGDELDIESTG